jgi:hypothetical protein
MHMAAVAYCGRITVPHMLSMMQLGLNNAHTPPTRHTSDVYAYMRAYTKRPAMPL